MRYLLSLLLLFPISLLAAVGDITGASVETNGWVLRLYVEGLTTNGMFYNGFATNHCLSSTNKLYVDVTSMGYDATGAGITLTRRVYGTKLLRRPFPAQTTNDVMSTADGIVARIALSDWIYAADSNLTLTALSGAYSDTNPVSPSSAISSLTVTNESTNIYAKPIAKWSIPDGLRFVNTAAVSCVAFSHHPIDGKPNACVKFWAVDTNGSSTVVQTITDPIIDWSAGDAVPIIEYKAYLDLTGLAEGPITNHFEVFPCIGSNTLSTADGRYAWPSPECVPLRAVADLGTYGSSYALVSLAGNDSNGRVTNVWNSAAPPPAFLTFSGAATALNRSNFTWFGRSDCGGEHYLCHQRQL